MDITSATAWLFSNAPAIVALAGVGPFLWKMFEFFSSKRREFEAQEFEQYHRLVKELVQPDSDALYTDRLIAIVFEFRQFKRYWGITERMLLHYRQEWDRPDAERLMQEFDRTLAFIRKNGHS